MQDTIKTLQETLETIDKQFSQCEKDIAALQGARMAYGKTKEMLVAKIRALEEEEQKKVLEQKEKVGRPRKRKAQDKDPANAAD